MARRRLLPARPRLEVLEAVVTPATFTVNNTLDGAVTKAAQLPGSLRQAVFDANALAGPDAIVYDAAQFASSKTMSLTAGYIWIKDAVSITGPAAKLTIDGNKATYFFNVDVPGKSAQPITIAGLTLTNGKANSGGGAIFNTDEALALTGVAISGCSTGSGGAIAAVTSAASLALTDCVLSGNTATDYGGAIYAVYVPSISLLRTTISNCTASTVGAIYNYKGGPISATDCTFSGNTGGAIAGNGVLRNCTIANNPGGGVFGSGWTLENCTVAFNTAIGFSGGGINSQSVTLASTIVAGNMGASGPMDMSATKFTANNSLIGVTTATITGSNNLINVDAKLDALANNGGPTQTCLLLPGSPAIDAGSNPNGFAFDQRGTGFPRVLGAGPDIGAAEGVRPAPTAEAVSSDVSSSGATAQTVTVTYGDQSAISVATIGTGDITVSGPFGFAATPALKGIDFNTDGTPRVATYEFTPPGGAWDPDDNGSYVVTMVANEVANSTGLFVPAGTIGGFTAFIPTPMHTVKTMADSGPGSLRQAVLDSNMTTFADTITFAPGLAGTVTLTSDLLITDDLEIQGDGRITLTRTKYGHIMQTSTDGLFNYVSVVLTLTGLTLRDTDSSQGPLNPSGAAVLSLGTLTLRDCVFSNNVAIYPGAAGGAVAHGGALTVERCTFTNNVGWAGGGALSVGGGPAVIRDSVFSGNTQPDDLGLRYGGALTASGTVTIEGCTFSGNFANSKGGRGGAIALQGGTLTLRNSTVAGNGAHGGGGLYVDGTAVLQNVTLTNNGAGSGGGIYVFSGSVEVRSGIVSGNSASTGPDIYQGTVKASNSAVGIASGITTFVDEGNNLAQGTNLKLGGLGNNGGLTQTIALLAGSPCVNAGANPAALAYDQRGVGFARVVGKAADIGAFEVQPLPPEVASVVINNGDVQRSRVTTVTINFDQTVTLPANPADAFQLKRQSDGALVTLAANVVTDTATHVTLTFTGGAAQFGSLADGRYTLTAFASKIANLDGNADGVAGDDYVLVGTPTNGLYRLFGDGDGDGDTDAADFSAFRGAFGTANLPFDADGDGDVDAADFGQFRQRFGVSV